MTAVRQLTACAAIVAAVGALASCERADEKITAAIEQDVILGDECFYTLTQRPEDCFERAPCAWWDARLHLSRNASGTYELVADAGGWDGGPRTNGPEIRLEAQSPEALARQFPEILDALHETPPPASEACVVVRPDQSLRVQEVQTFHRTLAEHRPRHIGYFAELAHQDEN